MRRRSSVNWLLVICFLQLISTIQRQTFDFLGHQWLSILVNFVSILAIILMLFGIHTAFKAKFVIIYLIWQLVSVSWNCFLIAFYLDLDLPFTKNEDFNLVNLWTGSRSWWQANGPNCQPTYNDTSFLIPASVRGCLISYEHVETIQAALQISLSILAFPISCYLLYLYHRSNQDDSFEFIGGFDSPSSPNSHAQTTARLEPIYSEAKYAKCKSRAHNASAVQHNGYW